LTIITTGAWETSVSTDGSHSSKVRPVCPGHFLLLKFGRVAGRNPPRWKEPSQTGSNSYVEKEFKFGTHNCKEYKDLRFGDSDYTPVVDVYLPFCQVWSFLVPSPQSQKPSCRDSESLMTM
jgi:hypothetical protein